MPPWYGLSNRLKKLSKFFKEILAHGPHFSSKLIRGQEFQQGAPHRGPSGALTHTKCPRTVKNKSPL